MDNKGGTKSGNSPRTGSSTWPKRSAARHTAPPSSCAAATAPPKEDAEPGKYAFQLLAEHCYRGRQGNRLYRCDVCGGVYRHAFSLKRHYLRSHVNYIYLSHSDISNCGIHMPASGVATLIKQTESSSSDGGGTAMPGLFRCHLCGALFNRVEQLKEHVAQHPAAAASPGPKPVAQPQDSGGERRLSCPQCRTTFSQRQYLTRHLATAHTGEKPFQCRYCGKGFPTVTNQRRHERIHEGLKPYVCPHCPAGFTQSGDLKKHIRSMHGDRFHPCTMCRKYFSAAVALAEHSVTCHGAPKVDTRQPAATNVLSCGVCAKKLASFPALCRHYRMCHPKARRAVTPPRAAVVEDPGKCAVNKVTVVQGKPLVGDAYFYANVARNISENLRDHIDGKIEAAMHPVATPTPPPEESDVVHCTDVENKVLSWSHYNFPDGFNMTAAKIWADRKEPAADTAVSASEEEDDEDALDLSGASEVPQTPESEPETLDPLKTQDSVFVCYVCGETFGSTDSIEIHKINNHPNVFCTHLELEGLPRNVPYELFKHRCSPEGALGRIFPVVVPPPEPSSKNLNCTKCGGTCGSVPELHEHILACGVEVDRVKTTRRVPVFPDRRVIRRGMKRRLEITEERYARYTRRNGAIVLTSTPVTTKTWSATLSVSLPAKRPKRMCRIESEPVVTRSADNGGRRRDTDCKACGQVFHHQSGLLRHQRYCQQKSAGPSPATEEIRKQHGCPHCGRHFTYMASLRKHVNAICPQRPAEEPEDPEKTQERLAGKDPSSPPSPVSPVAPPDEVAEEPKVEEEKEEAMVPVPQLEEAEEVAQGEVVVESEEKVEETVMEEAEEEEEEKVNVKEKEEVKVDEDKEEEKVEDEEKEMEKDKEEEVAAAAVEAEPEEEKVEGAKKDIQHSCPNCRRSFTYLANFKKHVNELCPLKEREKARSVLKGDFEDKKKGSGDEAVEKKKPAEPPPPVIRVKAQSFPCTICHRVFFSYLQMLKHRLSHKLKTACHLASREDGAAVEGGRSKRLAAAGRVRGIGKGDKVGSRGQKRARTPVAAEMKAVIEKSHISVFRNAILSKVKGLTLRGNADQKEGTVAEKPG